MSADTLKNSFGPFVETQLIRFTHQLRQTISATPLSLWIGWNGAFWLFRFLHHMFSVIFWILAFISRSGQSVSEIAKSPQPAILFLMAGGETEVGHVGIVVSAKKMAIWFLFMLLWNRCYHLNWKANYYLKRFVRAGRVLEWIHFLNWFRQ